MRKFTKNTETATQGGHAFRLPFQNKPEQSSPFFSGNEQNTSFTGFSGSSAVQNMQEAQQLEGFSNVAVQNDDDLVSRLFDLITLHKRLEMWFVEEPRFKMENALAQVESAFKPIQDNVMQADVDEFIKKMKEGTLKTEERYASDFAIQLTTFFEEQGSEGIVGKLKNDGEECIRLYKLIDLGGKIRDYLNYYNMTTIPHMKSKTVTQKDIDMFMDAKALRETFKAMYNKSGSALVKNKNKEIYDTNAAFFAAYEKKLADLQKAKAAYDLKGGIPAEEQLNPAISGEDVKSGVNYKIRSGKVGKEDNENQQFLKSEGLYSDNNYKIYSKGKADLQEVDMNDAIQGALGDCYLISSIASIALKNPAYIQDLISYNPGDNFANVTLYIRNPKTKVLEPKKIRIDFYFPVKTTVTPSTRIDTPDVTTHDIAYAKKGDKELWVMMIEKAYAQEKGSYEKIVSGSPAEALEALTGEKAETQMIKEIPADVKPPDVVKEDKTGVDAKEIPAEKKGLRESLKDAIKDNKTAVAGTIKSPDGSKTVTFKNGEVTCELYYSHAYSILKVDENAIELRNPHGGDKAVFSISLDDFRKYFENFHSSEVTRRSE